MTQFNPYSQITIVALSALLIWSCGNGNSSGSPKPAVTTLSGQAVKGPISGGIVTAYAVTSGVQGSELGSAITDNNGNYTITIENYSGPVLLNITGGTYQDEATGNIINLPLTAGTGLQAAVGDVTTGGDLQIQITPLTTMAVVLAKHTPDGLTAANIALANQRIESYFGLDPLITPPVNPLIAGSAAGASQASIDYGLILGGLSELSQSMNLVTPMDLVNALLEDISDASFDGLSGDDPVMMDGAPISPSTGNTDLGAAINSFSANPSQNISGGSISPDIITALTEGHDFSDSPQIVAAGYSNTLQDAGIPNAITPAFTVTGTDLAAVMFVQYEHPEMGYDQIGGAVTPTTNIPDRFITGGDSDGFYIGPYSPGTHINITSAHVPVLDYYGGEQQGLIEDGESAFSYATGLDTIAGIPSVIASGSSGSGSVDVDGIQLDSAVISGLVLKNVKQWYGLQSSNLSLWTNQQATPVTAERTVQARPGDLVISAILVNVGSEFSEGNNAYDSGCAITAAHGETEHINEANPANLGSALLTEAHTIIMGWASKRATGIPNESGFVDVDVGWTITEISTAYPDRGPGWRFWTLVASAVPPG